MVKKEETDPIFKCLDSPVKLVPFVYIRHVDIISITSNKLLYTLNITLFKIYTNKIFYNN